MQRAAHLADNDTKMRPVSGFYNCLLALNAVYMFYVSYNVFDALVILIFFSSQMIDSSMTTDEIKFPISILRNFLV